MTAVDLARYIVNYCYEKGNPISNLQLQKVLFIVNNKYCKRNGRFLINEPYNSFKVYPYGPTVPYVYNYFKRWGSDKILYTQTHFYNVEIKKDEQNINKDIDNLMKISIYDLVKFETRPNSAWAKTKAEFGLFSEIKTEDIFEEIKREGADYHDNMGC